MEIILLKDVDKVGNKLDIVTVKNGYGRNFLIPQGLAMIANKGNRAKIDEIKAKEAENEAALLGEAQGVAAKLQAATLKIGAKAGESGKIFGSVTNIQIAQAIQEQLGIEVDRRTIQIPVEVKELGSYIAKVALHKELTTDVNFEVVVD